MELFHSLGALIVATLPLWSARLLGACAQRRLITQAALYGQPQAAVIWAPWVYLGTPGPSPRFLPLASLQGKLSL